MLPKVIYGIQFYMIPNIQHKSSYYSVALGSDELHSNNELFHTQY